MVVFIFALPLLAAESNCEYTLAKSIQEAFANNPSIKARQDSIDAARFKKKQARTNLLPTLSTSYAYTHVSTRDYSPQGFPLTTEENYLWRATLEQPVFEGFAVTNTIKLAGVDQDLRQIELEIEKRNLALKVKRAYFDILRANRTLEVASQAVETIRAHVNTASMFFEAGKIPADDLLEAEIRFANWQEEWIHAQNEVYSARAIFNKLLARPLETHFIITDVLMYKPISNTKENYLEKALNNRLEIKAIDLSLRRAALEKQIVQSAYYPNVSLRTDYIKEGDKPWVQGSDFHKENNWLASVVLTWCFWEWGKTYYSGREKQSLKKQLLHTRSALIDQISLEIKEALLALQRADKNIHTISKAVKLAKKNLRIKQERYQMQITTSTEVLDALTLFSEAQNHYNNALYDHNLSKAKLVWALGDY